MAQNARLHIPATQLVDEATLQFLRARSNAIGAFLIVHCWAIIFGAMTLFYMFPNPLTFILAISLIGARQLGLAILMHDAAHFALFSSPKANIWLSDIFCAFPVLADTASYRRYHLQHHAHAQQSQDPDLILSKPFPITRKSLWRKLIRDLTGQTGYQQRKAQILNAWGGKDLNFMQHIAQFRQKLGGAVIANMIIFALCALLFHWSYYFIFWLLPFLTYHMAITRLRNIAEHAIVPDDSDPFRNARTTRTNMLTRLFLAPYWVNYHVEHHLIMHIPCFRLGALHNNLVARGFKDKMELASGYIDILRRASSRPNEEDKPGDIKHHGQRRRVAGNFTEGFEENK